MRSVFNFAAGSTPGAILPRISAAGPKFCLEELMAKVVSCRDVGMDCDFVAKGDSEQDVLQQCADHARTDHGMDEIPAEVADKVRAAIHDEAA